MSSRSFVPMFSPPATARVSVDLSLAGWFLLFAGVWELVFNRLASSLGVYSGVGATGFLSILASSGRLAMNSIGIMALIMTCIVLPRLAADRRFAVLPARVVLMLSVPFFLPVICVAVFRPVSEWLVLIAYLVATGTVALITVLVGMQKIGWRSRRVVVALGIIQILAATELITRFVVLYNPASSLNVLPRKAYLLAEVLYAVVPIVAFFVLKPGPIRSFVKRPPIWALVTAAAATAGALVVALYISDITLLRLIAFRTMGITLALPGGIAFYLISIFFGTLTVGSMILPSRRWPPTPSSRRTGMGLIFIWIAGIQPTHPYLVVFMFVGFVYIARGYLGVVVAGDQQSRRTPVAPT